MKYSCVQRLFEAIVKNQSDLVFRLDDKSCQHFENLEQYLVCAFVLFQICHY